MPDVLGIRIDKISKEEALEKVLDFVNSSEQHTIFTPNPEMLVDAHRDEQFKNILNSSSLNICDGKGIELFSREKIQRIPGVDFMLDVCNLAEKQEKSVYLLGAGKSGGPEKTAKTLKNLFPKLIIAGFDRGPRISNTFEIDNDDNKIAIENVANASPDIIFVAFGHKKQEWWIHTFLKELPSVRIAMGVGGSFDYISGNIKRAPKLFQKVGLEWLFRLICEPKRFKRILKAILIFPYLVIKERYAAR